MKTKGQKLLTAKLMIDRIPTDAIRASHEANREGLRQNMEVLSRGELIEKFFIEMDAKNEAYFFIMENGYFFQFRDYCLGITKQETEINPESN